MLEPLRVAVVRNNLRACCRVAVRLLTHDGGTIVLAVVILAFAGR